MSVGSCRRVLLATLADLFQWLRHADNQSRREVARTALVLVAVEMGLRTLRLPTLARWAGAPLAAEDAEGNDDAAVGSLQLPADAWRRVAIAERALARWPFDEKCLRRSLVCGWLLRRWHPQLVIGVTIIDGEVKAHAWLTVNGASLDPDGARTFSQLGPVGAR